ncbi:membrane protein [Actinoplanes sp. SE50]|uniref:SHOCT domain-containing protein n=1 Tax=unclassified Actinoplanes TaxID=2626549 RepID=UPI00023EBF81|nr:MULTISPECIES: SHOCT domain-containing protein [unclassified Actinoplanes]AEV86308.1 hypothetical protein ACPL_5421 [Actinoplanes sp. SE50/110]ATO84705.1 membrane protein [Actinoplanes sp. SE50]SLM02115.1 membrane protein [Actinoplanes sp. SE50/110]
MFDDNGSFLLATLEFFVFCAWFMCLFWVFGDLFRSRDLGGGAKTTWTVFLILLPIIGMLTYLIARGHDMSTRALEAQADARARQDAYIRTEAGSGTAGPTATEQITTAKELLDSGAIDRIEYEQLKAEALGTKAPSTTATGSH